MQIRSSYILMALMGLTIMGCHYFPDYHQPKGYSSSYVKALKCGPQGGAQPLRSIITRPDRMKYRMSTRNMINADPCRVDTNTEATSELSSAINHAQTDSETVK